MGDQVLRGFAPQTIDKVERLLDLLDELSGHPSLRDKLALHGGTAINLFMLDIPRLSVDIDISYVGALGRDAMLADRPTIERSITEVALAQGYSVSGGKGGHAGCTFVLGYGSLWGPDHIKIDCIYMNRSPLLPVTTRETALRRGAKVSVFSDTELVGGKVKALFDRVKARDLYDISNLKTVLDDLPEDDRDTARKVSLFYASLSASFPHGFDRRPQRFANRQRELDEQLLPMLRAGRMTPTLEGLIEDARTFIGTYVTPANSAESEYLERFAAGDYHPELIFPDKAMVEAALTSPEAMWKLRNLRMMG